MKELTDEQIRKHRSDVKAKALAEHKQDKNWKNKLFEDDDNVDSETSTT